MKYVKFSSSAPKKILSKSEVLRENSNKIIHLLKSKGITDFALPDFGYVVNKHYKVKKVKIAKIAINVLVGSTVVKNSITHDRGTSVVINNFLDIKYYDINGNELFGLSKTPEEAKRKDKEVREAIKELENRKLTSEEENRQVNDIGQVNLKAFTEANLANEMLNELKTLYKPFEKSKKEFN